MPTITQFEIALTACLYADPPVDHRLSPDASALTTVFAEMRYNNEASRDAAAMKPKQIDAYERWKQPV